MKELIEVFRMEEVSKETRVEVIIKLGYAIDYHYASNVTGPIVYELVKLLNPNHPLVKKESEGAE